MSGIVDGPEQSGVSTNLLATVSIAFMALFLGGSVPLGVYAYDSKNELIQALTILVVPFSLWGWVSFLRKALHSVGLSLRSLGTTKVSLVAGIIAIVLLLVYGWTKSNGVWLALEIGLSLHLLALLVFNYRYTRRVLLAFNITIAQVFISLLALIVAFWLWISLIPPQKNDEP